MGFGMGGSGGAGPWGPRSVPPELRTQAQRQSPTVPSTGSALGRGGVRGPRLGLGTAALSAPAAIPGPPKPVGPVTNMHTSPPSLQVAASLVGDSEGGLEHSWCLMKDWWVMDD